MNNLEKTEGQSIMNRLEKTEGAINNDFFLFWCFNATFNNISAISWRPDLVVEETGVPGEIHRPWASNW